MTKRTRPNKLAVHLVRSEAANLPTKTGLWRIVAFRDDADPGGGETHLALIHGDINGASKLLTRVHSECLTSEVFGSLKCDCDDQLRLAMLRIQKQDRGLIIYLRQEGRGIGIFNKVRAYHMQDHGFDTVEANRRLGLPIDSREYPMVAAIIDDLKVKSIRLMTNNPDKMKAIRAVGVKVSGRVPIRSRPNRYNRTYLQTKKLKMHHDL